MPALLCRADEVQKLHAICMVCGENASRTQRLVNGQPARYDDPIILVGASEAWGSLSRASQRSRAWTTRNKNQACHPPRPSPNSRKPLPRIKREIPCHARLPVCLVVPPWLNGILCAMFCSSSTRCSARTCSIIGSSSAQSRKTRGWQAGSRRRATSIGALGDALRIDAEDPGGPLKSGGPANSAGCECPPR